MSTTPNKLIPMRVWNDPPLPTRRELLWITEGKKCHWCGQPTRLCSEVSPDQATVEHIISRGRGGTDDPSNLASACCLCNQRRAYEDQVGLPDGKLLGVFPITAGQKRMFGYHRPKNPTPKPKHIALTGDEKKAIVHGGKKSTEEVLREQRDQALIEIAALKRDLRISEGKEKSTLGELTLFHKIVEDQEKELEALKSLTVWKLIRKRLAQWLEP